jgi:DNA-directed RNA polymerase specialized sigma24 family protein
VLAQRHLDRIRPGHRLDPLPADDASDGRPPLTSPVPAPPSTYLPLIQRVVTAVIASLAPKDRLRLAYYYAQDLTLAQIGRALGEHEATVSRNLARARRDVRAGVERRLREDEGMGEAEISECFAAVVADTGTLDVTDLLGPARKTSRDDRSKERPEGASA